MGIIEGQKQLCEKYGSEYYEPAPFFKVGISKNFEDGVWPINGMSHPLEGDTTGWYIWAGEEFSYDKDFFVPLHVKHIEERYPLILKYLGLAPGWRFLIAKNYEDVWQDDTLLIID